MCIYLINPFFHTSLKLLFHLYFPSSLPTSLILLSFNNLSSSSTANVAPLFFASSNGVDPEKKNK